MPHVHIHTILRGPVDEDGAASVSLEVFCATFAVHTAATCPTLLQFPQRSCRCWHSFLMWPSFPQHLQVSSSTTLLERQKFGVCPVLPHLLQVLPFVRHEHCEARCFPPHLPHGSSHAPLPCSPCPFPFSPFDPPFDPPHGSKYEPLLPVFPFPCPFHPAIIAAIACWSCHVENITDASSSCHCCTDVRSVA